MGKIEVAFVVGWHAHNRAGAVIHKHVVGDPNWHLFTINRIDSVSANEHALLFQIARGAVNIGKLLHLAGKFRHGLFIFRALGELGHHRMFWSQHHIGYAEDGVHAGGENRQLVASLGFKHCLHTLAAANPVVLHCFYLFRPTGQLFQVVQQTLGVISDFEKPLV